VTPTSVFFSSLLESLVHAWLIVCCSNMATDELASKLQRRTDVIASAEDGEELPVAQMPSSMVFNPYTEFKEFSRKEIQHFQKMFTL